MSSKQNLPARRDENTFGIVRQSQRKRFRKQVAAAAAGVILEAIGEIPGLKTAIKVRGAAQMIRDELFENKVASFLGELADVDEDAQRRFIDELAAEAGTSKKAGVALALILDRLDDMEKPAIIGRIYRARLEHRISFDELRRFCRVVDHAHLPDLVALFRLLPNERVDPLAAPHLHALGLIKITGEDYGTLDGVGAETWHELNDVGRKFLGIAFR